MSVQYPGREDRIREAAIEQMDTLTAEVSKTLMTLERPVALFGHSMGAAVAYEVARRIQDRRSPEVTALIVSGRPAPASQRVTHSYLKSDDELWDEVRQLGGTPEEVLRSKPLRDLLLPSIRRDYQLSETYVARPGSLLACPVYAFLGSDDPEVTFDAARAWASVTTGPFSVCVFPGEHFFLVPYQSEVLRTLTAVLSPDRADPISPGSSPVNLGRPREDETSRWP